MRITAKQYQEARKAIQAGLGGPQSNYAFRRLLGVSLRQAQRYESGDTAVPEPVGKLLFMLWRHGVPAEFERTGGLARAE